MTSCHGMPECYGHPARVEACAGCRVRMQCYEIGANLRDVFLLPRDRAAIVAAVTRRTRYVEEQSPPDWEAWRATHGRR